MDKSEVYPLLFIALFLVIYSVFASTALGLAYNNDINLKQPVLPNYSPNIENTAYEVYDCFNTTFDGKQYYNVTNDDYVTWMVDVSNYHDVLITVDRQHEDKYMTFWKQDEGSWFNWDYTKVSISKDELIDKMDSPLDVQLEFDIELQKVFSIAIVANPGDTLMQSFGSNEFTVIFGERTSNVTQEEQGAFDSFIQLVTFSIPDIDPVIGFLISAPISILGTYLIVRIILMFLPFVSGGA